MVELQQTYSKNLGASLVREYLFRTVSPWNNIGYSKNFKGYIILTLPNINFERCINNVFSPIGVLLYVT